MTERSKRKQGLKVKKSTVSLNVVDSQSLRRSKLKSIDP